MTTEERVTHTLVRDVEMPDGTGTLALLTLDNGSAPVTPNTLGPTGLGGLRSALHTLAERAAADEIVAVAVTGAPHSFAAGADLTVVDAVTDATQARALAQLGHATYRLLGEIEVPTFAFINGVALGGGLELALHCDYRTVASDVPALGLPEVSLGLVPGWGGTYLLPRLVGIERALQVILTNPLSTNRLLRADQAYELGVADALLDPADFLEQSIAWAGRVLSGQVEVERGTDDPAWDDVVAAVRRDLEQRVHPLHRAPWIALDLVAQGRDRDRDAAFAAEDDALTDLIMSDEMRASVYAFRLTGRGAKQPADAPDPALARPIGKVGIVGAGLMASQLALLSAHRLGVPVVMRDLDGDRVAAGLGSVRRMVERMVSSGRMSADEGRRVVGGVRGTTDLADLAGSDLVIEAVTEQLGIKRRVFGEIEGLVDPAAVLATNTSALSVAAIGGGLDHPGRVVGLHFFNPVARMPLVEVVRTPHSSDAAVATAFAVARGMRKTAVAVADRAGFVVNRLLLLLLAEVLAAVEDGTPVEVAESAVRPLGLPMSPFALLQLVGTGVARHVLQALHEDLGPRYRLSPGLDRLDAAGRRLVLGDGRPDSTSRVDPAIQEAFDAQPGTGPDAPRVLDAVLTALTTEIGHMLDEDVVSGPEQIDLCMILGAGWPFHIGGICPYLDRTGYAERVLGRRLLPPGVASVPPG